MSNRRRGRVKPDSGCPQPYQPYHFTVPMFNGMHSHDAIFDLTVLKEPAIDVVICRLNWPLSGGHRGRRAFGHGAQRGAVL